MQHLSPKQHYEVVDRNKQRKPIPQNTLLLLLGIAGFLVLVTISLIAASKQRVDVNAVNGNEDKSEVVAAKQQLQVAREAVLEKLSRTDYSTNLRVNNPDGTSMVGWRQLAAARWSQDIKTYIESERNRNQQGNPFYRMHMTPGLEVERIRTLDTFGEVSGGNNEFYLSYKDTEGTEVKQKLPASAVAYLLLGKLEAIDLAHNLESQPSVDFTRMLTEIQRGYKPYVDSQKQLLRAQGYSDPLKQMSDVNKAVEELQLLEQLRREQLKELYRKGAPEPKPVIKGGDGNGGKK